MNLFLKKVFLEKPHTFLEKVHHFLKEFNFAQFPIFDFKKKKKKV